MINQMTLRGEFSEQLKIAEVIPLYKKGDKTILSNYKPISLLPSLSKICAKNIFNQIYAHFDNNNLFYTSQYGFRKTHITEYAALELIV